MKNRNLANLIMVAIIAAILLSGVGLATMLTAEEESSFGSAYQITPLPDNRLVTDEHTQNLCTVSICCDTALHNADKLEPAKIPYVPEDGVVLPLTTVEFSEGETAFDVLTRVCEAAGLQIEYSWTPLYDSYYVEGINHLYEFDCGVDSGWMYEINGGFPNYGSSAYTVKPGDKIEWKYTCSGQGTDAGGERQE